MDMKLITHCMIVPDTGGLSYVRISENGVKLRSVGHSRYDLITQSVTSHIEDIVHPNPMSKHNPNVGPEDGYLQFAFFKIHHKSKVRTLHRISTVFVHDHQISALDIYDCMREFIPGDPRSNEDLAQHPELPIFWKKDAIYHGFGHVVDYTRGGVSQIDEALIPDIYKLFGTSFYAIDKEGKWLTREEYRDERCL